MEAQDREHYRALSAANLAEYQATISVEIERGRAAIAAGLNAMKSAMLINGGAAVALLGFIGHIWEKDLQPAIASNLTWSVLYFMAGVLTAAVATGTTYLSQSLHSVGCDKTARLFNGLSISLVILSYLAFAFGGFQAYTGFVTQLK